MTAVTVDAGRSLHRMSPNLYGIFFEDINFSADGGLNANMVNNFSFDGVYLDNASCRPVYDALRYWQHEGISLEAGKENPLSESSGYARIGCSGQGRLINLGYNGLKAHAREGAMFIKAGHSYNFDVYARSVSGFEGKVCVFAEDDAGSLLTEKAELACIGREWKRLETVTSACAEGMGRLVISFEGEGCIDLDLVRFSDADVWGKDDPKWKYTHLRRDLVQALINLKPAFVRFPGGCIVEGLRPGNEYNWKNTVGALQDRKPNYNLWSEKLDDGGYSQSYQIGFYEYFCLCEDLGAEPQPTLFAGLNCQIRAMQAGKDKETMKIDTASPEFKSYVIDNYLDLIEFANADPGESSRAALRAEMGHPAPFNLKRIGIGNENFDKDYFDRFALIKDAIREKYPDMEIIMCAGFLPHKPVVRKYWRYAEKLNEPVIVDEHSYHSCDWFYKAEKRFDKYPRGKAKCYFGEYSANGLMAGRKMTAENGNYFETALAEAAFLTGVERNSDAVCQVSYAPLFNLADCDQWFHNLIDFNPETYVETVNYKVQRLFGEITGTDYVGFEGKLPKKCYMSAVSSEELLIIKLVNASASDEEFAFELKGAADGEVDITVLASDNPEAKNRIGFTGGPEYACAEEKLTASVKDGRLIVECKKQSVTRIVARR